MSGWKYQALVGIVGGTVLFLALFLPALAVQYRRFGRPSLARLLVLAAGCIYVVALFAYTLLPLPSIAEACHGRVGGILQTTPFQFVADIIRENRGSSVVELLTSRSLLQVALNVLLFFPLGVLLRGPRARSVIAVTASGFALSLFIEATQYTGDWWIYPCGYRVADVDDLMANTLGALIGALVAPALLGWVPRPAELSRMRPVSPSIPRRLLGMLMDWIIFGVVTLGVQLAIAIGLQLFAGSATARWWSSQPVLRLVPLLVATVLVVLLPALVSSGASLGQRLVGLRPLWPGGRGRLGQRLGRALLGLGVYALSQLVADLGRHLPGDQHPWMSLALSGVSLLAGVLVFVQVASVFFGDHSGLASRLTGARILDARRTAAADQRPAEA